MGNGLVQKHNAKSLLFFAMPTIVMTVFMSLYTMVDGIFVANFVSAEALAGLNLVIPALSVLVSLSVLISAGGSVVISRKLGEGKDLEARQDLSSIVLLTVVFGAIVTVLAMIFADPVLRLLGTTDALYDVMMNKRCSPCAYLTGTPGEMMACYPEDRYRQQLPDESTLRFIDYIAHEPVIRAILADGNNRVRYINATSELIPRGHYRYFSLLAADDTVKGVTVEGGKYPLKNARLKRTHQFAVSNEIEKNCALISVKKGGLFIIESRDPV